MINYLKITEKSLIPIGWKKVKGKIHWQHSDGQSDEYEAIQLIYPSKVM